MKKLVFLSALCLSFALAGAPPYGGALQRARQVAGPGGDNAMRQAWIQMDDVMRANRGRLPGPPGVEGLKALCAPGRVSPELLRLRDLPRMDERRCPVAYVGCELGDPRMLPRSVGPGCPVLFTKPAPGVPVIEVLMAGGHVKRISPKLVRNCSSVIHYLKRESRAPRHPVWARLERAAALIDQPLPPPPPKPVVVPPPPKPVVVPPPPAVRPGPVLPPPPPKPAPSAHFRRAGFQMLEYVRSHRGVLPAPSGVRGLRILCGPRGISPENLRLPAYWERGERNCPVAYVGCELGFLRDLPRDCAFPVLFTKPVPGGMTVEVLLADGRVRLLDARHLRSCRDVINQLQRESGMQGAHPVWRKLLPAADFIDRSR